MLTELVGWLDSSVLAVAIALVILQFFQDNRRSQGQIDAIFSLGKAIANLGGTSFYKLDLSHLNFCEISLANIDLRAKKLYRTRFTGTTGWDAATVDDSYLDLHQPKVQALLKGEPITQNFFRTNLRGAYLQKAVLQFNRQTCFQGVICEYIYREFEDGERTQRYPVERNFLPGEFEVIVRKIETSYELVFEAIAICRDRSQFYIVNACILWKYVRNYQKV
jgi:hypothetical protein